MLRVVLPQDLAAEEVKWYAFDDKQQLHDQGCCAIQNLPAHKMAQLILPASVVSGYIIPAPNQRGRHQSALIDQMLEDILLDSREDTHVLPAKPEQGRQCVWLCNKHWLAAWQSRWDKFSKAPIKAYAIHDLLPVTAQPVSARTVEGHIFRLPDGQTGLLEDFALVEALAGAPVLQIEKLFERAVANDAVNFLAGLGTANALESLTPARLRRSAWLAGAVCATLMLATVLQWQRLAQREQQLRDGIRQTFAAAFPGIPIVDPYLQWQSLTQAGKSQAQADALDQLVQLASQLPAVRPRSADVRDGQARLLLTESDLVTARAQLQQQGQPFTVAPAEAGFVRLDIPLARR